MGAHLIADAVGECFEANFLCGCYVRPLHFNNKGLGEIGFEMNLIATLSAASDDGLESH